MFSFTGMKAWGHAGYYAASPLDTPNPFPQFPHSSCRSLKNHPSNRINKAPDYRSLCIRAGKRIYPPRCASTILNDILGYQAQLKYTYLSRHNVSCQTTVGGRVYSVSGHGSKKEAKEALAYKIIPSIVKEKLKVQSAKGPQIDKSGRWIDFKKREDETPWASLCSLALYKLFEEWNKNGFTVPESLYHLNIKNKDSKHPIAPGGMGRIVSREESEPSNQITNQTVTPELEALWKIEEAKTGKAMPENPTSRNPVQLINEIRCDIKFVTEAVGAKPNSLFETRLEIEGCVYSGKARSKKESKRLCAMQTLKSIYKLEYPESHVSNPGCC